MFPVRVPLLPACTEVQDFFLFRFQCQIALLRHLRDNPLDVDIDPLNVANPRTKYGISTPTVH